MLNVNFLVTTSRQNRLINQQINILSNSNGTIPGSVTFRNSAEILFVNFIVLLICTKHIIELNVLNALND